MYKKVEKPKLRLGYAPNRRDSFRAPLYKEMKAALDAATKELCAALDVELIDATDLEFPAKTLHWGKKSFEIEADTMMVDYADAKMVAEYFKAQKIDALFIPFCNFGQEEAVAKLAKEMNVPVLIYGPRDPAPIGIEARPLDIQCGMFAATKVLQRYGVKFTYIENCNIEDDAFKKGFAQFISTAHIVKAFKNARILQVATRPQQFLSVMVSEAELLEKFGIELVPITGAQFVATVERILENKPEEVDAMVADIEAVLDMSRLEDKRKVAAVELGFIELAQQYGCTAIATDCWHTVGSAFGFSPCFILGDLNDRGIPTACEEDIHAAIASLMAVAATGNKAASFVADLTIRHPENDNAELLWHCGPFAKQLKKPGVDGYIVKGGQGFYQLKDGEMTTLRFDGLNGNYYLFVGKGEAIDGPSTNGNYCWLEVDNWVKWEKKFMYGPYIHHLVGVYGDHVEALRDACRYIGITYDTPDSPMFL